MVLFEQGDEVITHGPFWPSIVDQIKLADAKPVIVQTHMEDGFKIKAGEIIDAITPRTKAIVINSPCNPTGAVYSSDQLQAILDVAADREWWVLSDEIYQRIVYEAPAPSALDVAASRERLLIFNGVAKAYAMTGWRIGWAIAPTAVARTMTALQSHTTSNAATVSQHAALAALTCRDQADRAIAAMVAELRRRRDAVCALLRSAGVDFIQPAGAFYVFICVAGAATGADPGSEFARRLLEERDVAVVPGAAFGTPDWVRLSFAAPFDDVLQGARRIIRALS
jgi:aspartate aminotransferase